MSEIKGESKVVIVLSADEDANIHWTAVPISLWEEKLELSYKAGWPKKGEPLFIDIYNDMCDSNELIRIRMDTFTSIPPEILTRCLTIVHGPMWS